MKLITKEIQRKLEANAKLPSQGDLQPVVKLFTPDAQATWIFTCIEGDLLFGLCDLGMGFPELGYASLAEIESLRGKLGLPVERDLYFTPDKTLQAYADEARAAGGLYC